MKVKRDPCDIKFSELIRERDGKCVFCGRVGRLECSHFWGRGMKATRFDPLNCDALCFTCHAENEGNKQGFYRSWKISQLGQERYDVLARRAQQLVHYGKYEQPIIMARLREHGLRGLTEWLAELWPNLADAVEAV